MSKELAEKLEKMDISNADIQDANTIAKMMGYAQDGNDATEHIIPEQGETTPTEAAPVAAVVENSETPAAVAEQATEIAGVLTKDGKHVIPNAVLTEARKAAATHRMRADDLAKQNELLEQQLADLKAGKPAEPNEMTEEFVAEMEEAFPEQGVVLRKAFERLKTLDAQQPAPRDFQKEANDEVSIAESLDAALASRPLLTQYREKGGVVWDRAVEIDQEVANQFPDKSLADRFVEVEKKLASELGIQLGTKNPPAATAAPQPNPEPTQIMPTLTDLGGRGVAVGDQMAGLAPGQMVDRAMSMDMEQLRRMVGLSY